ncbi:PRC-barrel domain protein [Methanobrevibacter cuticularis]|uniref:PRC-barrel domain protein n=1 Tax=Methanobrevibacter cuticularis TaxID=47311 RepID=A0A166FGT0_9EURY|nr:PRC-barrel domain-containing protein [Methanobrevibacter cuticularis]KZX17656.1 PRC-barrel domain protein [Methanobrevibacter cuticularis]
MKVTDLIGMVVVDKNGESVGTVNDVDIDENSGSIKEVDLNLNQKIFSDERGVIEFDQIEDISYAVLLNAILDLE